MGIIFQLMCGLNRIGVKIFESEVVTVDDTKKNRRSALNYLRSKQLVDKVD